VRLFRLLRLAPSVALAITAVGCATTQTVPSETVTTLDPAGSRWFQLQWTTTQVIGSNAQRLDGYVLNNNGEAARVQLLAQALSAAGQVVDQRIEYPDAPVPGMGRSFFHIGPLAAADHYQVTVWSAYFFQGGKRTP
jgi:hypothetical protein